MYINICLYIYAVRGGVCISALSFSLSQTLPIYICMYICIRIYIDVHISEYMYIYI